MSLNQSTPGFIGPQRETPFCLPCMEKMIDDLMHMCLPTFRCASMPCGDCIETGGVCFCIRGKPEYQPELDKLLYAVNDFKVAEAIAEISARIRKTVTDQWISAGLALQKKLHEIANTDRPPMSVLRQQVKERRSYGTDVLKPSADRGRAMPGFMVM